MYRAGLKVLGGKLVRVKFSIKDNRIYDMRITGDFFLHPEDGIEDLERRLNGTEVDEKRLNDTIHGFLNEKFILIGAKPEDFVRAIFLAIEA